MRKSIFLSLVLLLTVNVCLLAQKTITGKITDAKTGKPIGNASIMVSGTTSGTASLADGTFSIVVPQDAASIDVSVLGYKSKSASTNASTINFMLDESNTKIMDEVIVVGYGTKIKKDLTGNIAKVKGADVQNMPVTNLNQALQGRAAGVFVESNNGKVGEGVKVLIRGSGSISASNSPLYVVDGIPISTNSYSGNPIADINFNDVESFDILKDASAAAIYGSRAANGVVLITTKKGRSGKTTFQVNSQFGINNPTHYRGFLDAKEYVALLREAAINSDNLDGVDPLDPNQYPDSWLEFAEGRLDRYSGWSDWRTNQTNTNWEKLAFNKNAATSSLDVSATGGTDKTKFYLSLSSINQTGILIGNRLKRVSSRINLEQTVSDKFKVGFNLSLTQTKTGRVAVDNEFSTPMQIVALSPVTPQKDLDGNNYNAPTTTYSNPYVDYVDGKYNSTTYRNIGNIFGQYTFNSNWFFRSELGVDLQNQNDDQFYGANTTYGNGSNGYGESDWYRGLTYNSNNYFNFKKKIKEVHDLDAVVGMSFQQYNSDFASVYGEQFPTQQLQKLASAGLIKGGSSNESASAFLSYFARANYKFNNKYLLSVSTRIDGSSVFGIDRRYGFFPSVSAGWVLSEEKFLHNVKAISFLKLRASWGLTGNADGFGNFASRGLWDGSAYNGSGGLVPSQLANPDLRWEKSNQTDIGIDFGIFNNKISGEIDYYSRKTNDLIYNIPVPGNTGYSSKTVNVGSMENSGFEFVLNTENISKKNFKWSTSFNFAANKNKITKLDGEQTLLAGNDGRYLNSLIVGQSIGVFYGPKYAGVDPTNGDALYYKQDGTKTNDYNEAGNYIVGNPNPKCIAGISNTVSYKGFDLSVLFQGVFGNQIMNGAGGFMSASFDWFDNQTKDQLNRWRNPGDITNVPQLRLGGGNGISASSRYIEDGDYVRLKNITLAYNIPASTLKRLKLTSAKIYVTGVNLLTFTNYTGWDPEVNTDYRASNRNQGGDFYAAPQIKNYSFGLNLGF